MTGPRTVQPTFIADTLAPKAVDVTHEFELQTLAVGQNINVSWIAFDRTIVTVTAPPVVVIPDPQAGLVPVADAGPNRRVLSGTTVTLDGTGSTVDPDRSIKTWAWTRESGTGDDTVALSDPGAPRPTFPADTLADGADDVTHVFSLVVTDSADVSSVADTVTITVIFGFADPVAKAGPDQRVLSGKTVNLDGTGSTFDPDRPIMSWSWRRTGGTQGATVTLNDANISQPSFTADVLSAGAADVTHDIELTVTDSAGATDTDTVTITVMLPNDPPVAVLGPDQTVPSGALVSIYGNNSMDSDGSVVAWSWRRTGGTGNTVPVPGDNRDYQSFRADTLAPGDADVTHVFELIVTDNEGAVSAPASITVTVTAGSDVDAGPDQTVPSEKTVTLDGNGSSDTYGNIDSIQWNRTGGTGGRVTLSERRALRTTFTADTRDPGAVDVTHDFVLQIDRTGNNNINVRWTLSDTTRVTVTAPFKAPVAIISGEEQREVASGGMVELDGSESTVDHRRTPLTYLWARTDGTSTVDGTLEDATTATPSFTAETLTDGAEDVTHILTLTVTDSANVTATDTVEITVISGFAKPVAIITGEEQREVASGGTMELDGSASTVDRRREIKSWEWTSDTVTLTGATTETPTFVADSPVPGAADVIHVVSLRVTDDADEVSEPDTVTITVIPGFKPPVADAGPDQDNIVPGTTVNLDGSASTVDRRREIKSWEWTSDTVTLTGATTETPTFVADSPVPGAADVIHVVSLRVTDDADEVSEPDTVTITVIPGFKPPVADAGPNQDNIVPGTTVNLDGSASTVDRRREIKSWEWTSDTVTLTGATTETPTFVADSPVPGAADVIHVVSLRVTDDADEVSEPDTVTITVIPGFKPPVADAGPDQDNIVPGTTVNLDGSASTVDRRREIKSWEWTSDTVTLTGATTETPTFVADSPVPGAADVIHVVSLRVTDDADEVSEPDTVTITVIPGFKPPVADAGPDQDNIVPGTTVNLDGSASTVDRRREIKSWEWTSDTVTLTGATTETPTFVADSPVPGAADVIHVVSLRVTDDADEVSEPDTVTITVIPGFKPPVADAGPDQDNIVPGTTVNLDGSASTVDRRREIKSWEWTSDTVTLTGATTETPTFVADSPVPGAADVIHVVSLRVTDDADEVSEPDTVTITVIPGFKPPVADAGPDQDNIVPGTTVNLDGSASTVDRRREIKSWEWTSDTVTLTGATTETPTFVADSPVPGAADVIHVVSLRVTDDADEVSEPDTVTITVIPGFKPPVADAGPDQDNIVPGTTVNLDGSASTVDRRREIKSWEWTSDTVTLTGATTETPTFVADSPVPGAADVIHVVSLRVTDDADEVSEPDTVTITVIPGFKPPVADAGPDQDNIVPGTTVNLDGSASTVDRRREIKSWEWTSDTVTLTGATTETPTFVADSPVPGAADVIHVVSLRVTDDADEVSEPDTVTITVIPGFKPPVADAGPDQDNIVPGTTVNLDGSASTVDRRREIKSWEWTSDTVTLTGATTETPTFVADSPVPGAADVIHVVSLRVTDDADEVSEPDTVTITVIPGFKPPVADAGPDQDNIVPGTTVNLDGSASTVDRRREIKSWEWTSDTVTLTGATTETPTFVADSPVPGAADVIHVVSLRVTDDADEVSEPDTVTITVIPGFKPPVADAGPDQDNIVPGTTVNLDGSASTVDRRREIKSWEWTSDTVTLTGATTETPTFVADSPVPGAADVIHVVSLRVTDDADEVSEPDTVTITVIPGFKPPVADAGPDQDNIVPGTTVNLDGSASTVDRRREIKSWEWTSDTVTLTGATTETPTFVADSPVPGAADVIHVVSLRVTDDADEVSEPDTVTITVIPGFKPPVADAGPDQDNIVPGTTVNLDGSASTVDRRREIKSWEWTSDTVTLTGATTETPTFVADSPVPGAADVIHVVSLRVTDDADEVSEPDTVTITVIPGFKPPVADAGPDQDNIVPGTTVNLDGSASTVDRRREIKSWEWTSDTVTLTGATTETPTFVADSPVPGAADVIHVVSLRVTDDADEVSEPDTVTITVIPGFKPPVADAGPDQDNIVPGTTVNLDGSASTVDRRREIKSWEWTSDTVTLTGATTETPTFVADSPVPGAADVIHVVSLRVTDDADEVSEPDTVTITVIPGFKPPVADAGPDQDNIVPGTTVNLDGSASTVDRRREIKSWEWTSDTVTLTGATTETPTFVADSPVPGAADVIHVVSLRVTDDADEVSEPDTVTITVIPGFKPPVADAGPDQDNIVPGTTVNLDGSASTVDRRREIKSWEWTSDTVTLTGATTETPTFVADSPVPGAADVIHVVSLRVTDDADEVSEPDTVTITVIPGFKPPVADAGPDQDNIVPGTTVNLDGSASTVDRRREIKSWEWTSDTVTLTGATTETPTFVADSPVPGAADVIHVVSLRVTDDADEVSEPDTVTITVIPGFKPPVADAGPDQDNIVPGTTVNLDGSASTVDRRREIKSWEWTSDTVTLTGATTETPTFVADSPVPGAADVIHVVSLRVTDDADEVSEPDTVTITVIPGFKPPVADAGPDQDNIVPGTTVNLDGSASTVDRRREIKSWEWTSDTVTLTGATTETPTFVADSPVPGAADVIHVVSLRVTDDADEVSEPDTVTITVIPGFKPPVADAGPDQDNIVPGTTVNLDGSASTVDRRREIKSWEWTSDTVTLTGATTETPTFVADSPVPGAADVIHVVSLRVTDDADEVSEPDTVTITVIPGFKPPVADAGPDQDNIVPGTTVNLDGSASTVDRRREIKSWEWTSDTVTLTGATTETPTFVADSPVPGAADVIHVVSLRVTDDADEVSEPDTVTITVIPGFKPPVADAGPDQDNIVPGTTVNLDGSASTVDRRREIKSWEWTSDTVTLTGATTETPTFVADSPVPGAADVIHVVSLRVTDDADEVSEPDTVTITVIPGFKPPVADAGPDQDNIVPGTTVNLDGSASTVDRRREIKSWEWTSDTVTLTGATTETPTFVADSPVPGAADVIHVVSLRVTDDADEVSEPDTVTITVIPGFKPPVADAGPDQDNIVPGTTVNLDGSASTVDRRREIKSWEWTSDTVTLTGATTETPTFVADSPVPGAADVIHVVSLRVTDDADEVSEPDTVTITVIPGFKPPVADAGPDQDNIVPGTTVNLDGSASTVDRRREIKSWEWTSDTVTLTGATTETPTFVADSPVPGAADVIHVVSLRVTDDADEVSEPDTVTITVIPGFKPPVADAGPDQDNIVPGTTVNLDGSASTVDRRREIKSWEWTSDTVTLTGATTETPTFVADSPVPGAADVIHVVSLRVTDDADEVSEPDTVTITVIPGFKPPVADAGPDQDNIVPGTTVNLDGSASTVDRRREIKSWEWTSDTVTLTGATTETPTFVADSPVPGAADVIHVVSLRVTDDADEVSEPDTVTITVIPGFKPPVADAGPDQDNIVPGTTVNLDGSASTVDRRREIKSWEWTSDTVTLTGATTETPTFVADSPVPGAADVIHVVSLRVTDDADEVSEPDTVTITVIPGFKPPVADAGPDQDNIVPGTTVNLDGSASTVDRRREIKSWEWTSDTVTLTGATTETPTFVADSPVPGAADVIHVVSLRVTDDADEVSEPDTVTITVIPGFKPPVADAGPDQDNIVPGTTVNLDGSASTVDRRREIKSWEWTSDTVTLTGATTETPTFVADSPVPGAADVIHVVSLRVTDDADEVSEPDTVTITVIPGFKPPVADAGPDQDNIVPGTTVNLDGSASTVDRRREIKSWEWTSDTVTLTGATTETPTFVADSPVPGAADVIHVVSLRVTDDADEVSEPDTVTITVIPGFKPPVADAGPDQDNIVPGTTVNLDGSASTVDRRREIKSWEWTSDTVTLTGATTETPTFVADSPVPGAADVIHVVSLRVTDDADEVSEPDTVTITVIPGFKPPVADAGPDQDNIVPGTTVNLDGSASTVDRRREIKSWEWTSDTVTLTGATTETPTFVADSPVPGAADVIHVVSLRVTDDADEVSEPDTVTITVIPGFKPPVADAGPDQDNIVPGTTVNLDGSASTVDRRREIKSWEWTSDTVTLTGATTETPTFVADSPVPGAADVIHVVSLRVTDDADEVSEPDTVTITVIPGFKPPVADAGPDQDNIVPGTTVNLDGSASTVDRRREIKSWEWTSDTVTLTGATTETPTFVADSPVPGAADVIHVVSLRVTDDADEVSEPDTVTITVIPGFKPPVADAGPDQDNIVPGTTVNLDGSASTVDRRREIKSWEWTSDTVTLTGATTETPTFVADSPVPGAADVIHVVSLRVTDDADEVSEPDTVTITVIPGFKPPVADAGPDQDNIVPGTTVNLDGSASTVDRRREIKSWEWTSDTVTLTGATTETPTFVADSPVPGAADVIHVVSLRVTDDADEVSEPDTVTITVIPGFKPPVADAGPDQDNIVPGTTVNLDGSASTVDRRREIKSWEWTSDTVTLTGATTETPTFVADSPVPGAADVIHVVSLRVTDDADEVSEPDTVTITVIPGFKPPVADAGPDQDNIVPGTTVNLDGSASTVDRRREIKSWEWTSDTVTLTGATTETPTFVADSPVPGAADVIHVVSLRVTDDADEVSEPDTVTITVIPGFKPPVADAGPDQDNIVPGTTVNLDGSASTVDRRREIKSWEWTSDTVTLTGATTETPTFVADSPVPGAADVIHVVSLRVTDDADEVSEPDTVTITVIPGFKPPVADAGPDQDNIVPGTTVNLDGSASTVDRRREIKSWEWTSDTVTLTGATTETPTFVADSPVPGAADVIHVVSLRVTDDADEVSEPDTVTITVIPGFKPPVADAGPDQDNIVPGTTVNLDGSASTVDRRREIKSWEWTSDTVTLTGATTETPTFVADSPVPGAADVIHVVSLRVTDDADEVSEPDTVTITVIPGFKPPVADAGPNQDNIVPGTTVNLDGSASTVDRRREIKSWEWTSDTVTLTGATTETPTFVADSPVPGAADVIHVVSLRVTDDADEVSEPDTVTITVIPGFKPPVADAGPDQDNIVPGTTVNLDGSASTVDRRREIKSWEWTSDTVTLTGATTETPTFVADSPVPGAADGIHVVSLRVTDDADEVSEPDTVTITVIPGFKPPVADAGPDQDNIVPGTTVNLDGSASTVDRRREIKSWEWTSDTVTLTGATTETPTFVADSPVPGAADVIHVVSLRVTDDANDISEPDMVTITVIPGFKPPVADAGPDQDNIVPGTTVNLDGSASTVDRRREIKSWEWTSDTVTLTGATTETPTFVADSPVPGAADVIHVVSLRVTDDANDISEPDMVEITVISGFAAPMANAGPDQGNIVPGATVNLDGSASTVDRRREVKAWAWTSDTATLTGATTATPSFTADSLAPGVADVTHVVSLVVTDDANDISEPDMVEITIVSDFKNPVANARPVADAGEDQKVVSKTTVTLDGSGSTDRDGTVESYSWRRTAGTGGDIVVLANENTPQMRFTADTMAPGADDVTHIFELVVTDNTGAVSEPDTVTVTVSAVPLLKVGILVSRSELTVQEGESSAYQVRLSRSPGQEVTIEAVSDNEDVVLNNAQLLFNEENWGAWQNFSISTVADTDKVDDKALIRHTFIGSGLAVNQSGVVSVTVREVDPVLTPVGEYLATRATALLNKQRKLIPFLKQDGTIPGGSKKITLNATNGRLSLDGGFVRDGIWGEVTGSYTRGDYGDIKSVLGSFGIHWKNSERFLAGVMLQFDLAENDLAGRAGSIDGAGWLAGPYFAARHGTQPLYFEGRLLYGQSDNDIRFMDTGLGVMRTGSFDTRRLLAQVRLEGEIAMSDRDEGPRLIPYADARWIEDRAKAFTDNIGNRVPGQKVSIGQLELGSNIEVPIAVRTGEMTFTGGLGLVWSNTEGDYITSDSGGRGRGEIGFSYGLDETQRIEFESFYDGIGSSRYENYGLSLSAEMKF